MGVKAFLRGLLGIKQYSLSYLTDSVPIEDFPLPEEVILVSPQVDDVAQEPLVKAGDQVRAGQEIWAGSAVFGGGIFAPISGEVVRIEQRMAPSSRSTKTVVIASRKGEGQELRGNRDEKFLERNPEELWERIRKFGVVSLGHSLSPLINLLGPVKLPPGDAEKLFPPVKKVIVSALDQEPGLAVNPQLLRDQVAEVSQGLYLLQKLVPGAELHLAVPVPLAYLAAQAATQGSVQVAEVKPEYPQGIPYLLIKEVLKIEVPQGRPFRDLGIAVINLETLLSALRAARDQSPTTEKIITVSLPRSEPKNLRVRIGTPVREILKHFGKALSAGDKIILGGPLLGWAQYNDDTAITRKVDGLILQHGSEMEVSILDYACVNCGRCVEACPVRLQPNLLSRCGEFQFWDRAEKLDLAGCIECGLCGYVCSAQRPVMQYIQYAKLESGRKKQKEEAAK